jgi:hypothetical protein
MTALACKERLKVLELVAEIAGEASQNTNVVFMIESQEELVERLYRKMVALLDEPGAALDDDAGAEPERTKATRRPQRPAKSQRRARARPRTRANRRRRLAERSGRRSESGAGLARRGQCTSRARPAAPATAGRGPRPPSRAADPVTLAKHPTPGLSEPRSDPWFPGFSSARAGRDMLRCPC